MTVPIFPAGYVDPQAIFGPAVNAGIWRDLIAQAGNGVMTSASVYGEILRQSPALFTVHPRSFNTFGPHARGTKTVKKP